MHLRISFIAFIQRKRELIGNMGKRDSMLTNHDLRNIRDNHARFLRVFPQRRISELATKLFESSSRFGSDFSERDGVSSLDSWIRCCQRHRGNNENIMDDWRAKYCRDLSQIVVVGKWRVARLSREWLCFVDSRSFVGSIDHVTLCYFFQNSLHFLLQSLNVVEYWEISIKNWINLIQRFVRISRNIYELSGNKWENNSGCSLRVSTNYYFKCTKWRELFIRETC